MAVITHGGSLPDESNKSDFYAIIDNAVISGITNSDISNSALIASSKLATITTASKVDGSSLFNLSNIPANAGIIPATSLTSVMPSGAIIMWSGTVANIPTGFVLCNGSNSTPDLRDRFIVGAKQDDSGIAKTNITGSLTKSGGSVTISENNLPSHLHTVAGTYSSGGGSSAGNALDTSGGGSVNTSSVGSGAAYTQPYYALCFIMKT